VVPLILAGSSATIWTSSSVTALFASSDMTGTSLEERQPLKVRLPPHPVLFLKRLQPVSATARMPVFEELFALALILDIYLNQAIEEHRKRRIGGSRTLVR
jgi:hypothetical protein